MHKLTLTLAAAALALAGTPAAHAQSAYDPFAYGTGSLAGNNGGSGWAGAWTRGDANVTALGLSDPTGTRK